MAKIQILKKDGTPTGMFWSDERDQGKTLKRVFRTTDDGRVQRSSSIRYDVERKRLRRV